MSLMRRLMSRGRLLILAILTKSGLVLMIDA